MNLPRNSHVLPGAALKGGGIPLRDGRHESGRAATVIESAFSSPVFSEDVSLRYEDERVGILPSCRSVPAWSQIRVLVA